MKRFAERHAPLRRIIPLSAIILLGPLQWSLPAMAANAELNEAMALYKKGMIGQAIPYFARAAQQSPQNADAHFWYAKALMRQGGPQNLIKAQAALKEAIHIQPNHAEALAALSEILSWQVGAHPEVLDTCIQYTRHVAELTADNPAKIELYANAVKNLTKWLYWRGNGTDARMFGNRAFALSQDPQTQHALPKNSLPIQDPDWLSAYAALLIQNGEANQAVRIYAPLIAQNHSPAINIDYAIALAKAGQTSQADEIFQTFNNRLAATKPTESTDLKQKLANLAYETGNYPDALTILEKLPSNIQQSKTVQLQMARIYAKSSRLTESIDIFQKLYTAGQLTPQEKMEYGDTLLNFALPTAALPSPNIKETLFVEALRGLPNAQAGEAYIRLARLYKQTPGRFSDATASYEQAIARTTDPQQKDEELEEYLDFLKTDKTHTAQAESALKRLLASETPVNMKTESAYADFLSWQKSRRPEALRYLLRLSETDPANAAEWRRSLDSVLLWQTPSMQLLPLYQEVLKYFPDDKAAKICIARAYAKDKSHFNDALTAYTDLTTRYPHDEALQQERLGILISDEKHRPEAITALKKLTAAKPEDESLQILYAKLLSYDHRYHQALQIFDSILTKDANNKEARIGKGLTMLWDGKQLAAKRYLEQTHRMYPEDQETTMALIEAEKSIGRYDEALKLIQDTKSSKKTGRQQSDSNVDQAPYRLCVNERVKDTSLQGELLAHAVPDYSIMPPDESQLASSATDLQQMQQDLNDLNKSLEALQQQQAKSSQEIEQVKNNLGAYQDTLPAATVSVPSKNDAPASTTADADRLLNGSSMMQPVGQTSSLEFQDHHPLLSGYHTQSSTAMQDIENSLTTGLRPMLQTGYLASTQKGDPTTNRFDTWGIPNQLSFFLTPQVQVRAGVTPRRFYLPDSPVHPNSTWGMQYSWGATVKYWDRLTLDGDMAIDHYFQSSSDNISYQANAKYDLTDNIHLVLGSHRVPYEESLLSYTGIDPRAGAYNGDLVGQARENAFFGEINTNFWHHVDANLGYQWAFVNGQDIPTNYKNQINASIGYTYNITPNHSVRLGYQFVWFTYAKNATNGYFDITHTGLQVPVVNLDPVTPAGRGYVYGGYFSPSDFFLNALRLDFRGNFFNKLIEYRLGGSIGVQSFTLGHGIVGSSPTNLAASFDSRVVLNVTNWLGLYGDVDFLNAGGLFQRWRYGGGLILRPNIPALSPIIK